MLYDTLALYYDELLGDSESLDIWVEKVEKEINGRDILELACGSGELALKLGAKGYNVYATDISQQMIEVAKGKNKIDNVSFSELDDKKFDAILCFCDSFNYFNDLNEVESFIINAKKHLKDDGVLMFDTHHLERLNEFEDEYIEEGSLKDIFYQWTIKSDKLSSRLMEHFAFYFENNTVTESHSQMVFDPKALAELMANYLDTKYDLEFVENEKIMFVGRNRWLQ